MAVSTVEESVTLGWDRIMVSIRIRDSFKVSVSVSQCNNVGTAVQ